MNRLLSVAILMLVAASGFAMDRFNQDPQQTPIATTGRIMHIDIKTRTFKIRGAESQPAVRTAPEAIKESLWQRISGRVPSVHMPSIAILLPGRNARFGDYFVLTNDNTVFQDGSDPLHFEDFHAGETISIHGVLTGSTVRASRIARWD